MSANLDNWTVEEIDLFAGIDWVLFSKDKEPAMLAYKKNANVIQAFWKDPGKYFQVNQVDDLIVQWDIPQQIRRITARVSCFLFFLFCLILKRLKSTYIIIEFNATLARMA